VGNAAGIAARSLFDRRIAVGLVLAVAVAGGNADAGLAQAAAESPLRIESIVVSPERPADDTLCRLTVRLHNAGAKAMYSFAFDVKLDGVSLPVYERQLFLQAIGAGETAEVRLFNFWTTETSRPRPADGKLDVEVTVREALWLDITHEPAADEAPASGEAAEPVEVWTPAGEVPNLPVRRSLVLELEG
jgi:hypothetical protein